MNVTVIGGGTGSIAVLQGLKPYKDINLSTIVAMSDDGGSNQVLRDEYGLLPLSDLRKSILALSDDNQNEILRELFMYRFSRSAGLSGHTLGNLIMLALSEITGSEEKAIAALSTIFAVRGNVIPVTLEQCRLVATYSNGKTILGEHFIDEPKDTKISMIKKLYSIPEAKANPRAVKAILNADFIILGPGDLYTTTLANIIIKGIPQAIRKSKAKVIFISNIMSKRGQSDNMTAKDHVETMTKYMGRAPDFVILNNGALPHEGLTRYLAAGEKVVKDDLGKKTSSVIRADVVANRAIKQVAGDVLERSFIRHDAKKLGAVLNNLFVTELDEEIPIIATIDINKESQAGRLVLTD